MKKNKRRKKVLSIIGSLGLGGAERVVIDINKNLNKNIFEPIVCCLTTKGTFSSELEKKNIPVIPLFKKPKFDPMIIYKICKLIKKKKIDLVHTHLWSANFWGRIAAKISGIKTIIITEHSTDVWKGKRHFIADRLLSYITNKIIVVSNKVKEFYIKKLRINPDKFITIYNGIDLSKFNINTDVKKKKKEFRVEPAEKVLMTIGRLEVAKAHNIFLKALVIVKEKIPNFKAFIIGGGPLKEEIIQMTKQLDLTEKVIITGLRKDIPSLLSMANIFILSSTREGFPITLLEAMSMGIPAVVTKVGGNPELCLNEKTGFLVEPNNPQVLAAAIVKILTEPKLINSFSKNSRERVRSLFTDKIMVHKHAKLYLNLLQSN